MTDAAALGAFIREIRVAAGRMAAIGESLHADTGISPAGRAILELIEVAGPQAVPAIARRRNTSRQNIQVQVDALEAAGLVEMRANPGHKRSVLVCLSEQGRVRFREIRGREAALIARLSAGLDGRDLRSAAATIRTFGAALARLNAAPDEPPA
jgi:DNA-binding MarR family transcriptional regulator